MAEHDANEHAGAGSKRVRSDDETSEEEDVGPQHEEMYAGVSNLFAACEATNATRPKRHRTEEEKRQERLAANRRSARESRNRKKLVFEELQRSVARLAEENASLRKENETIRAQMSALKRQFGLADDSSAPAGGEGANAQGTIQGLGGVDLTAGLNLLQQGNNQGGGGGNRDQAQQLAMLDAAQQAQAQQQLQLAAAGLNPFGGNLEGGGQGSGGGGEGQGGDYQERLQLFQRRVEERSHLINQLKNSIGGGGGGTVNLEALRRQLKQQGQG